MMERESPNSTPIKIKEAKPLRSETNKFHCNTKKTLSMEKVLQKIPQQLALYSSPILFLKRFLEHLPPELVCSTNLRPPLLHLLHFRGRCRRGRRGVRDTELRLKAFVDDANRRWSPPPFAKEIIRGLVSFFLGWMIVPGQMMLGKTYVYIVYIYI